MNFTCQSWNRCWWGFRYTQPYPRIFRLQPGARLRRMHGPRLRRWNL